MITPFRTIYKQLQLVKCFTCFPFHVQYHSYGPAGRAGPCIADGTTGSFFPTLGGEQQGIQRAPGAFSMKISRARFGLAQGVAAKRLSAKLTPKYRVLLHLLLTREKRGSWKLWLLWLWICWISIFFKAFAKNIFVLFNLFFFLKISDIFTWRV